MSTHIVDDWLTAAVAGGLYLKLDQTTPQLISNGSPQFSGGLSVNEINPYSGALVSVNASLEAHKNLGVATISAYTTSQDNFSNGFNYYKRGNVNDSSGSVLTNCELGYHSFYGWDGTQMGRGVYCIAKAMGDWSTTSRPTSYAIATTPSGSTTNAIRLYIGANGNVAIGASSEPTYALEVTGAIKATNALRAPFIVVPTDSTTAFKFYKADGNTTVLTVDTTNSRFGVGIQPSYPLDVSGNTRTSGVFLSTGLYPITSRTFNCNCGPTTGSMNTDDYFHDINIPRWTNTGTTNVNYIGFDNDELYMANRWIGWTTTTIKDGVDVSGTATSYDRIFNHSNGNWLTYSGYSTSVIITTEKTSGSVSIGARSNAVFEAVILFRGTSYLPSTLKVEHKDNAGNWNTAMDVALDGTSSSICMRFTTASPYSIHGVRVTMGPPRNTEVYLESVLIQHSTCPTLEFINRGGSGQEMFGTLAFKVDSTTAFQIFKADGTTPVLSCATSLGGNGRLGIGVASPSHKLHVKDNGETSSYILGVHTDDDTPWIAGFYNDTYSTSVPVFEYFGWSSSAIGFVSGDFEMGSNAARKVSIYTNGYTNPRLTIDGAGLVGIGIVQSNTQLQVVGDVRVGEATTNYTNWDTTGHQTMAGTAKPWNDIRCEPVARTTGANAPTFRQWFDDSGIGDTGTTRGVYLYEFDDAAGGSEKEAFFTIQMPHDWDSGPIHVHVHWIAETTAASSKVRWGLEYTMAEPNSVFGATAAIVYADTPESGDTGTTAGKHQITEFASITPTTSQDGLSTILIGRVFRDSANGADTYNADAGLLYIDAHYQLNSLGSTDEYTK